MTNTTRSRNLTRPTGTRTSLTQLMLPAVPTVRTPWCGVTRLLPCKCRRTSRPSPLISPVSCVLTAWLGFTPSELSSEGRTLALWDRDRHGQAVVPAQRSTTTMYATAGYVSPVERTPPPQHPRDDRARRVRARLNAALNREPQTCGDETNGDASHREIDVSAAPCCWRDPRMSGRRRPRTDRLSPTGPNVLQGCVVGHVSRP